MRDNDRVTSDGDPTHRPQTLEGRGYRETLREPDGSRHQESPSQAEQPPADTQDTLELKLIRIWETVLGVRPVETRDDFFELGGRWTQAVFLLAQVERTFGMKLSPATLLAGATIEHMASILRQKDDAKRESALVAIRPGGSRPPFFCAHPVGGVNLHYRDLARNLDPDQPFYGLHGLGSDGKQHADMRIEDMAAYYIEEIRVIQPEGPYYLGGFSSGGLVAYEMAHQLSERGQKAALVAMFDTWCPGYSKPAPFVRRVHGHINNLAQLESRDKLMYIEERARNLTKRLKAKTGIWPSNRENDLRTERPITSAPRKSIRIEPPTVRNYNPPIYRDRIDLFYARQDSLLLTEDPRLSWKKVALGGVYVHRIPGSHLTILVEPYVGKLAEELMTCLARAKANAERHTSTSHSPLDLRPV